MVDVIPGATYYDSVLDRECTCDGVSPRDDDVDVVRLEYEGLSEPVEAPFHLMRTSDEFEVVSLPY